MGDLEIGADRRSGATVVPAKSEQRELAQREFLIKVCD
jgi:hypothetical protein